jgi:hypothetical protein
MESLAPLLGGGRGKPVSLKEKEKLENVLFLLNIKKSSGTSISQQFWFLRLRRSHFAKSI